jgi:hypothetical protein
MSFSPLPVILGTAVTEENGHESSKYYSGMNRLTVRGVNSGAFLDCIHGLSSKYVFKVTVIPV